MNNTETLATLQDMLKMARTGPSRNQIRKAIARVEQRIELEQTETVRYCATCGEPEGSYYAKRCCVDDNMLEG